MGIHSWVMSEAAPEPQGGMCVIGVSRPALSVVAEQVIASAGAGGMPAGFVLCIGDDSSDEEMFAALEAEADAAGDWQGGGVHANIFACTVGQKPSKASYYVNDCSEVIKLLGTLAGLTPADGQEVAGRELGRLAGLSIAGES